MPVGASAIFHIRCVRASPRILPGRHSGLLLNNVPVRFDADAQSFGPRHTGSSASSAFKSAPLSRCKENELLPHINIGINVY